MTINTLKFSQMASGGDIANNNMVPGLESGTNVLFNNPWTFLAPGSTADRPPIDPTMYFRLRFNTTLQLYEYYDSTLGQWTQLQETLFTAGPYVIYKADASLPDAFNLGSLTTGLLKQTVIASVATPEIAILGTDYYGPGFPVPIADGGTGATTAAGARANLGLGTMAVQNANAVAITGGSALLTSGQVAAFPSASNDLANKLYVDSVALSNNVLDVRVATTSNLSATYSNGSSGIGATLTATSNGAASVDGVSLSVNDRVLFKNQSTTFQNGIYYLSTNGTVSTPAIYTRSTDYDQPAEITVGDVVIVSQGTANANSSWRQTSAVTSVGVDAITFTIFSQYGALPSPFTVAGTSVTTTGTQLNLLNAMTKVPIDFITTQIFTSTGTYTPTSGMKFCFTHTVGGGGGSGGTQGGGAGTCGISGAGGAGGEVFAWFDAATIGASRGITIGAGGTAGPSGNNAGGNGGFSAIAGLVQANGGNASSGGASSSVAAFSAGGSGGTPAVIPAGQVGKSGETGTTGFTILGNVGVPGIGGSSTLGGGGRGAAGGNIVGSAGTEYGSGGGGSYSTTSDQAGAAGSPGVCFIVEFCSN